MKYVTGAINSNIESELEKQNREIAYKAATEGIVLLKNNGVLPLKDKKIALFGAGAKNTIKGGTGSGEVNERYSVNIYDGLLNRGFTITSNTWLDTYQNEYDEVKRKNYKEAKKAGNNLFAAANLMWLVAKPAVIPVENMISEKDVEESDTDTAVYVLSRQAGEAGDRLLSNSDYTLTENEIKNIRFMAEHYKNTVLVLNVGSSMDLNSIDDVDLSAIVFYCQQGEEGGNALADVLSGSVNPSGKLTDSWPMKYEDLPYHDKYSYMKEDKTIEEYHEDIYVGYRYYDSFSVEPRYPFGYGLSYTDFSINYLNTELNGSKVKVNLTVTNTGCTKGKEVVQLYVSAPDNMLHKEYQRLVGFVKTKELDINETESLSVEFDMKDCASYDEGAAEMLLEEGLYILRLGNSSRNTKAVAAIDLNTNIIVSKHQKLLMKVDNFKKLVSSKRNNVCEDVEHITFDTDSIVTKVFDYDTFEEAVDLKAKAILDSLTTKEKIDVVVGDGFIGGFIPEKIYTPGTVGKTTVSLYKKGLVNVNLCDGPAGVRILRRSAIRGKMPKLIEMPMEFMNYFPDAILKLVKANPEKDEILYQYATAFPVATSLAQSWNKELWLNVGEAISKEMNKYLVTYWLAPGMNIHRNPLCGRNFEYYSEDPFLSGMAAAHIVKGVQSTPGSYATIKHFAANNQEDNREHRNSKLSVRALREIYLKGFEYCVKEADPKAIMTSYNLINGIYAMNCKDTIDSILRKEWGFGGVVMTDWYSTKEECGNPYLAVKVGNDMLMPGTKYDKKIVAKAIKDKTLSMSELNRSALRIITQIINSNVAQKYKAEDFD